MFYFKKRLSLHVFFIAMAVMAVAQVQEQQSENLPAQIDMFLSGYHPRNDSRRPVNDPQPLVGHGRRFDSEGATYNMDPRLVTAIAGAETSFGFATASTNNAFNWFWNAGTGSHNSPFEDWDSGIHTVSHYLHKSYVLKGYNTIPLIGARYCTAGCEHWVPNVTTFYQTLGADPNGALSYPGAVVSPASQPTLARVDPPSMMATLAPADPGTTSSTGKGLMLTVQATFTNLNSQTVKSVELYRDFQLAPVRLAVLKRMIGSPETAPAFSATFTLPAGDQNDLRVLGQIAQKGHPATQLTSGILTVPKPPVQIPWLMIGVSTGGLLMLACIAVLGVLLLRSKTATPQQPVMMQMPVPEASAIANAAGTNDAVQARRKTGTDSQ